MTTPRAKFTRAACESVRDAVGSPIFSCCIVGWSSQDLSSGQCEKLEMFSNSGGYSVPVYHLQSLVGRAQRDASAGQILEGDVRGA